MPLGAALSETLASFATASHSFWAEAISLNKLVIQEDIGIVIILHACPTNGNHSIQMPIVHLSSKNMTQRHSQIPKRKPRNQDQHLNETQ